MYRPLDRQLVDPYSDWDVDRIRRMFGHAELTPADPVTVGEFGSWSITYFTGAYGLGRFGRVALPFKYVSGWGAFQNTDPSADNYFSVECSNPDANIRVVDRASPVIGIPAASRSHRGSRRVVAWRRRVDPIQFGRHFTGKQRMASPALQ